MEQSNTPNPGKGMGTGGFIIGLVAFIVGFVIWGIATLAAAATGGGMGLAIGWTVLSAVGLAMSVMGMNKSKAAGHKAGLAMVGLIMGILALLLSLFMIYSVHVAGSMHNEISTGLDQFSNALDSISKASGLDTSIH